MDLGRLMAYPNSPDLPGISVPHPLTSNHAAWRRTIIGRRRKIDRGGIGRIIAVTIAIGISIAIAGAADDRACGKTADDSRGERAAAPCFSFCRDGKHS